MEGPKPKSHTIGPYEVESELGRGGMSVVYRAKQATLDRMVALKVMHESFGLDSDYAARFRQEAITVARLEHPGIVPVYDAGQDGASLYLAMRLVPGETLAKLVQDFGPMPLDRAVVVLGQVAEALDYAHAQGVIHRDIKPGNVLVEPGFRANLADFGIARTGGTERLTRFGTLAGTPDYLAPEVISGAQATSASDRYAFGIVAYEILSGIVPFTGETDVAVLFGHVNEPIPPISKLRPELPAYVDLALRSMLAKAPQDRFVTASAFVAALGGKDIPGRAHSGSLPSQLLDQVTSQVPGGGAAPQSPSPSVSGTTVAGQGKQSVQTVKGGRSPYLVPGISGLVAIIILLVLVNAQTGGRSGPVAMVAAMFASPTPTPIPPTATPTIEQRWVATQGLLGAAWEKDWPAAISALEAFRKDYPDHDESKQKLYAALVSYGKLQAEGGDRRGAVAPWVKAQDLLPGRGEAQQLLVALTPTPTPIPTNTPMPTATPLPRILASDNFSTSRRLIDDNFDPQQRFGGARSQGSFVVFYRTNYDKLPTYDLNFTQNNAALSVLASINTDFNGYVMLACRDQGANKQYRAMIDTDTQYGRIINSASGQDLLNRFAPSIRKGTAPNRIKFACIGSQLSLTVNDTLVGSVSDSSFATGKWWIASGNYSGQPSVLRTEFNDLIMTER